MLIAETEFGILIMFDNNVSRGGKSKRKKVKIKTQNEKIVETYMDVWRRNFSLVARCSLKFTRCSLLVVKSLVTRCKVARYSLQIRSLLVAEAARCKKPLVTRCKIRSLQKFTCYSLQNSLVTCCRSCLLQNITRYSLRNSLVTRYRSYSLQKVIRYSLQNLLVTRSRSWSLQKVTCYSLRNSLVTSCKT